jgi:hypothetical protein
MEGAQPGDSPTHQNETIGETGLRDFVVWDEEYEDLNDAP